MSAQSVAGEAERAVALRKVFCVKLAAVRSRLLGLSREDERALRKRHLVEGTDWREFGEGIRYSQAGLEKLCAAVEGRGEMTNDKGPNDQGMTKGRGILDTTGPANRDDTGISAERRSPMALNTVPTEAAQPVETRRRVLALLPEFVEAARSEAFRVRTVRCDFANRQVVEVVLDFMDAPGRAVQARHFMRVRSSENFLPGMACWARLERGESVWVFAGRGDMAATDAPVCPRSRGRW